MAFYRWQQNITDGSGNVLDGAEVEIRDENTGLLVNLFSDIGGAVSIGNPLFTDSSGYAFAYLEPKKLKITATKGAFSFSWRDVLLPEGPLGASAGGNGSDLVAHTGTSDTVTEALDKRTIFVGSVAESFSGRAGIAEQAYQAIAWHPGGAAQTNPKGGGLFVFKADVPKSDHNGGTIISPTVPPVSSSSVADFLSGVGETDPTGSGCFVRYDFDEIWINDFGAKSDGIRDGAGASGTDDTDSFKATLVYAENNKSITVRVPDGITIITDTLPVPYNGAQIIGTCENYGAAAHFSQNVEFTGRSTIAFLPTTEKDLFSMGGSGTRGQSIKNLNLFGNTKPSDFHIAKGPAYPTTLNSRYAIDVNESLFSTFENLAIRGFKTGLRHSTTQSNQFRDIYINYCREQCVLYDNGFPTSDVYSSCFFRTTPIGVNNAEDTEFLNIRFIGCLFEELDRWGITMDRKAREVEFISCYSERVGDDPAYSDQAMFRVGHTGTGAAEITNALEIRGGYYQGNDANNPTFLDVDACYGVTVFGGIHSNYSTVIKSTANTKDGAIFLDGLKGKPFDTFHDGDDFRVLRGTYDQRSLNDQASSDKTITRCNQLVADQIKNDQPKFFGGQAVKEVYLRTVPVSGGGFTLNIPIRSQSSENVANYITLKGQCGEFNSQRSFPFKATFGVGSLNSLSNLSVIESHGNVTGVVINGMTLEVSFNAEYVENLLLEVEVISQLSGIIDVDNITLTA